MTMFARPTQVEAVSSKSVAPGGPPADHHKRPPAWSLTNWPVRWKVLAIVLVPLTLASILSGLRITDAMADSAALRLAAARTDMLPAITKYMSALDVALLASSTNRDVEGAKKNFAARKGELQMRLADTDVTPDVRSAVTTLLTGGPALLDKVAGNSLGLTDRVTNYAPLLLTAEDVINASVRVDDKEVRAQVQGMSRAVGARGQMTMQKILVTRGADVPAPLLRTSMITLAGTEPSTLFGMSEVIGAGSREAKTLQQQMVTRMALMSNPASTLVDNPDLLRSIQTTDGIAEQVIADTTASVTKTVHAQANDRREAAVRDSILVLAALGCGLVLALLVARALVGPLRALRDGALKVAHTDLGQEVALVKAGGAQPDPEPLPVHTTEEIGQVAHAVDELHAQALQLAGDEARLRLLLNDMFETMSRRNRSLVDQQLALIDRLERNEEDPDRLDSLFRLDHLAARLRRNGANLLVLAGAQLARDVRNPVGLSTVINAAVSEVEDYRRVELAGIPDCSLTGAAAGGTIHLLAELIDNALRYSPPTTPVRISAAPSGTGGVVLRIADSGLGMNESDRRIANTRLQAGGDVTPEDARHMGLFVVGRIAARHGIRVGLRGGAANGAGPGTTAEVYLPRSVLEGLATALTPAVPPVVAAGPSAAPDVWAPGGQADTLFASGTEAPATNGGPVPAVTTLPRRDPGSSGIVAVPAPPAAQGQAPAASTPSAFSAAGPAAPVPYAPGDDDVIYRRLLAEMLGDVPGLADSPELAWPSVWDRGWSAAADADEQTVDARTAEHGLPVRTPGARLVPGAADDDGAQLAARDPEAVRNSFSSHFGGVRNGRSQARGKERDKK